MGRDKRDETNGRLRMQTTTSTGIEVLANFFIESPVAWFKIQKKWIADNVPCDELNLLNEIFIVLGEVDEE